VAARYTGGGGRKSYATGEVTVGTVGSVGTVGTVVASAQVVYVAERR
jgi:hypothetical protein